MLFRCICCLTGNPLRCLFFFFLDFENSPDVCSLWQLAHVFSFSPIRCGLSLYFNSVCLLLPFLTFFHLILKILYCASLFLSLFFSLYSDLCILALLVSLAFIQTSPSFCILKTSFPSRNLDSLLCFMNLFPCIYTSVFLTLVCLIHM